MLKVELCCVVDNWQVQTELSIAINKHESDVHKYTEHFKQDNRELRMTRSRATGEKAD
jgi:hypothetical protein